MPEVLMPNVNFLPGSPDILADHDRSAIWWDMGRLNDVLEACGADGIELHDVRSRHMRELLRSDETHLREVGKNIRSMHEGWRGGVADPVPQNPDIARTVAREPLTVRLGSIVLFPPANQTLDHLQSIERKLNRAAPMNYVVYPDPNGNAEADHMKAMRFNRRALIQPTVDVVYSWGIDPAKPGWTEAFVDEMRERELGGVWDEFHASRQGKVVDASMDHEALLEALLQEKLIDELHIGLFRHDFANVDPGRYDMSVAEGKAMYNEGELSRTILGNVFAILRHYSWQGPAVIEATHSGMEASLGQLTMRQAIDLRLPTTRTARDELTMPSAA